MGLRTVKRTNARNRAALDPSVPRTATPAVISSIASTAANTIEITFNTRVMLRATPAVTAGGMTPGSPFAVASASQISATVIELEFTGNVAGSNLVVPEGTIGVRTPSGGFIPAGSYAIPAFP